MFVVTSSSPPARRLINFFVKDDNQRRDFSSGYYSYDNILSKPYMFYLSETFVVENIRCKHRQIMQYLIFELRSQIAPTKRRGRLAEIFTYLKTRML